MHSPAALPDELHRRLEVRLPVAQRHGGGQLTGDGVGQAQRDRAQWRAQHTALIDVAG